MKYGIFYKSHGKWSKTPWSYSFPIYKGQVAESVCEAKQILKSKVLVKQLINSKWVPTNIKV